MKNLIQKVIGISMLSVLLVVGTNDNVRAQNMSVSFQVFYDNLAPYGQWIYDPDYGNVWVPNEDGNFRPYGSRGQWVMTEYGNTWVSNDPWGWAVYHYGRWTYNPYYGWVWIPGYDWAPAWVSWRWGNGYCGWAPLGPGMNVGVNYVVPQTWWIFMGPRYMYQPNCIRYWYGPSYNDRYIYRTTIINNYYRDTRTRVEYNYGPRAAQVQQVTRRPVQVYRLSQLNRPGAPSIGRGTVNIYRPGVDRGTVGTSRPSRVSNAPRSIGRGAEAPRRSAETPEFRRQYNTRQPDRGRGSYETTDPRNSNMREPNNPRTTAPTQRTTLPGRTTRPNEPQRTSTPPQRTTTPPQRSTMPTQRTTTPPQRTTVPQRPTTPQRSNTQQPDRTRERPRSYDGRMDNRSPQPQRTAPQRQAPQMRTPSGRGNGPQQNGNQQPSRRR